VIETSGNSGEETLVGVPMTVQSRHRLYTTERQRSQLGCDGLYGRGTPVAVGIVAVERDVPWSGTVAQSATFQTELGYYGEIQIRSAVARAIGVTEGDGLRVTVRVAKS